MRADPFFQSPESGKLGTAIKREALTRKGWQRRKRSDDLVHDRARMPAWILDENGVTALALHQGRDIGMAEGTFEDEEVALPMPKLRSISNKISRASATRKSSSSWA